MRVHHKSVYVVSTHIYRTRLKEKTKKKYGALTKFIFEQMAKKHLCRCAKHYARTIKIYSEINEICDIKCSPMLYIFQLEYIWLKFAKTNYLFGGGDTFKYFHFFQ